MISAYIIFVFYALLGFVYAPGMDAFLALIFIAASCTPFLFVGLYSRIESKKVYKQPGLLTLYGLVLLGMINLLIIAGNVDKGYIDLLSLEGFASIAGESTENRYTNQAASGNPIVLAFSLLLLYMVGVVEKEIAAWKILLAFIPVMLYTASTTEKWPLFLGGIFFLSGLFVCNTDRIALRRSINYILGFALFGFTVVGIALAFRGFAGGVIDGISLVLHYLLAPYPAFGNWLSQSAIEQCCNLGELTFVGPLDALGYIERQAGVHEVNYEIYGLETNIYTAFRYLVQDFSILGPFLLNLFISLLYGIVNYRPISAMIRAFVIFCALLSVNVTPFVHNSVLLAVLFSLFYSFSRELYSNTNFKYVWKYE